MLVGKEKGSELRRSETVVRRNETEMYEDGGAATEMDGGRETSQMEYGG
jgi:hypothetical protein